MKVQRGNRDASRRMPVCHTAHQCQATAFSLTPLRLCGWKKACPLASKKMPGVFAPQRRLSCAGDGRLVLGHKPPVLKTRLLKDGCLITRRLLPHGVQDAYPDIGEGTDGDTVAFPFLAGATVVLQSPGFAHGRLPGELVQCIAQRFDAGVASMNPAVGSTLEDDRRGASQRLQAGRISIALAIITKFGQQAF